LENSEKNIDLSIIIPAYNVSKTIEIVLQRLSNVINSLNQSYEFIVVHDGSSDNTFEILNQLKSKMNNLQVISYAHNRGKGYAIKKGVLNSSGKNVMYIDGDLDISTKTIPSYLEELEQYDIVFASKKHPSSQINASTSRNFLSKCFSTVTKILTNLKFGDTQVGLKMGRGDVFREIFQIMTINEFAFDVELLTIAQERNYKCKDMPIELDLSSSLPFMKRLILSFKMFRDVLKISYNLKWSKQYTLKS